MIGYSLKRAIGANPFVGPRPFETGRKIFGRDREIDDLYYLLSAERIVLLHSPSGAGKSSLIQAGLIPRLNERFDVWGPTRVNLQPPAGPSSQQTTAVNRYVRSAVSGFEQQIPAERRRSEEQLAGMTLTDYVATRPRRRSAPQNIVLLFDQFEEILTADPLAIDAKHEFFAQLGDLLLDPRIWVLFALREDYLPALDPYAEQVPTHLKNWFRLDLLRRDAARDAITGTTVEGGREFDPAAVDQLVRDLATMKVQQPDGTFVKQTGLYVEPLQLQVVCRGLWERVPEDKQTIDLTDIEQFGHVTDALSGYYAGEVARIADNDIRVERTLREWCGDRLITPDGIRGQVLRGAGQSEGLDNDLIASLVNTHLVRGEQRAGAVWYELAHDRLIEPVRANNRDWFDAHLHKVQKVATLWQAQGHPEGLLLLGEELIEARQWAEQNESSLTIIERKFLETSLAKQGLVDREEQQAKRLRRLLVAVAVIALLALAAAGYALVSYLESNFQQSVAKYQENNAIEKQAEAEKSAREADLQKTFAGIQTTIAQQQTLEADNARTEAERQAIIAHQQTQLAEVTAYVAKMNLARAEFESGNTPRGFELLDAYLTPASASPKSKAGGKDLRDFYWYYLWHQNPKLWKTLDSTVVSSLVFAPNGRTLAVGSDRGKAVPEYLAQVVSSMVFAPDGLKVASHSFDGTIKVWDAKNGQELATLKGHEKPVTSVAFSPTESSTLASASTDGTVRLWDTRNGRLLATPFNVPDVEVWSLAYSPDGRTLASASEDGKIRLWDAKSWQPLATLTGHRKAVNALAYAPDGDTLASGSEDGTVKLWDASKRQPRATLTGHALAVISSIAYSPDGRTLASGSHDGTVRLWDGKSGQPLATLEHPLSVSGVAYAPDGHTLASVGQNGTIKLWDTSTRQESVNLKDSSNSLAFSPNGHTLASASTDNKIKLWNVKGGPPVTVLEGHQYSTQSVAYSRGGLRLASGGSDHLVKVWDVRGGPPLVTFDHGDLVRSVAFAPDGLRLASAGDNNLVKLWDVKGGPPLHTLNGHGENLPEGEMKAVLSVAYAPDGRTLASGGTNGRVNLWDVKSGEPIAVFKGHEKAVTALAFAPNGLTLASASNDGTVKLWDIKGVRVLVTLKGHKRGVSAVAFAPDGRTLASASRDKMVKLWDTRSGQELASLKGNVEFLTSVAFAPVGHMLASAGSDGEIKLWIGASDKEIEASRLRE